MTSLTKRQESDILRFCNKIRRAYGLPPVDTIAQGDRNAFSCPIANTIHGNATIYAGVCRSDVAVWPHQGAPDSEKREWVCPHTVNTFVRMFDRGRLPEFSYGNRRETA